MFDSVLKLNVCRLVANQMALMEFTDNSDWRINLNDGELSFANGVKFKVDILGSQSFVSNTWLWGWANPQNDFAPELLAKSLALKSAAEENDIQYLAEPQFELGKVSGDSIAKVCAALSQDACHFFATHAKGGLHLLLRDVPEDVTHISPQRAMGAIKEVMELDYGYSHKEMFLPFLESAGFSLNGGGSEYRAVRNESELLVLSFDDAGRLGKMSLCAEPEPSSPWWKFWA